MYRYIAAGNSSDDDKDNSIMIKIKRIIIDNYDVSNKDNDDRNDTNDDKKNITIVLRSPPPPQSHPDPRVISALPFVSPVPLSLLR